MTNPPSPTADLLIHVDGASRGNPGPASVGGVLVRAEDSEYIGTTTNNVAEYTALIFALEEAAVLGARNVTVKTDSQLLARQYTGEYKTKEPHVKMLQTIVRHLARRFDRCDVLHVPREENKVADKLANEALDRVL
ncbi:MAG: ribonuclease HI family protein [Candidatus Omnitrophica bacterium]|nr:ribonuclease HI family protein [Candidatus Omnitrophota bacterium]